MTTFLGYVRSNWVNDSAIVNGLRANPDFRLHLRLHQAQLREVTLQEENVAYEKAISNCESKIQEKIEEVELLRRKLEELEDTEKNLRDELENAQTALDTGRSRGSDEAVGNSKTSVETGDDMESSKKAILDKLEERKRELVRCSFF
ncbi:uncharacterized protein LOC133716760 [Rosa rugosa]|uniref:uncharacterized protein LOC133716760 n=1 Tax=Rosa rugosa TaxID=74645 RepID=UPI002B40E0DB|nr:uncharacterized protein LOC133716760 [Rosa rugosa]